MANPARGRDADFPKSEYEARWRRAWALMREHGLGALLVTSEANYRYLTGHQSQLWITKSRPLYAVLPLGRRPITLTAEIEIEVIRATSYLTDTRTWLGFADDSLPALVDILREVGLEGEKVGVDFGNEMRLGLPLTVFRKLERAATGVVFVDGSPVLWALRQIKSPAEAAYVRKACLAHDRGVRAAWKRIEPGMTEKEVHRRLAIEMLKAGADAVPFMPFHSGRGGYKRFSMDPTKRRVRAGDIVWCDPAVTVRGYYSDFDRMAALGRASRRQRDAYRAIFDITTACVEAVRPGLPISAVVKVRDGAYRKRGFAETGSRSGRMGHGSGLEMTEPPSVAAHDHTLLEPGMVIHLEPKMLHPYGAFLLEEVVLVTETGGKLLTPRAPAELPVIG